MYAVNPDGYPGIVKSATLIEIQPENEENNKQENPKGCCKVERGIEEEECQREKEKRGRERKRDRELRSQTVVMYEKCKFE